MDIFFINLAERPDRRRFVENNFAKVRRPGWRLSRIDAVAAAQGTPGSILDVEKACFLSHLDAIEAAQSAAGHVLIAEDDILFGEGSLPAIESAVARMAEGDWDILFTDLVIPFAGPMADFFLLRQRLVQSGQLTLVELGNLPFAGSTAYIVNRQAKQKMQNALAASMPLDQPYDLQLRHLVQAKILRAYVIVPFPTTVSTFGDASQVQDPGNLVDAVWTAYRRLIWLERETEAAVRPLGMDRAEPAAAAFARILTAMQSPTYVEK